MEGTKTPKEIIYKYGIIIHIDQLNLLCQKLSNQRMIRWRLLLDDFHPQIKHIAGQKNLLVDAISRLEKKTSWRRWLGITIRTITIQQQRSKPQNDNVVDCLDFEPGCDDERHYKLTVEIEQKNNIHSVFDASNRNQLSNKRIHDNVYWIGITRYYVIQIVCNNCGLCKPISFGKTCKKTLKHSVNTVTH